MGPGNFQVGSQSPPGSVPRSAITAEIGRCADEELGAAEDALRRWLALS